MSRRLAKLLGALRIAADLGIVLIALFLAVLLVSKLFTRDGSIPAAETPAAPKPSLMTNSIGMKLAQIAPGEFAMGSASYSPETSVHKVSLSGYWIGLTEVTQGQYAQIMGASDPATNDLPAQHVSWNDAAEFCRRLSARENRPYRLPTEAQWEFACRAGSRSAFSFGDDDGRLGEFAWYDASAGQRAHPVATRKPNPWGLFDMHGNVWEWCTDWYQEGYYRLSPQADPQGPAEGEHRVLRGGCYYNRPVFCRSARRDFSPPDRRDEAIGFRVVIIAP